MIPNRDGRSRLVAPNAWNGTTGWRGFHDVDNSRLRVAARHDRFARQVTPEIPVLLRVAGRLTGQPADAEDLVQETLVRAYRAIDSFDGASPRAWLLTIMRRAEINRHRRYQPELLEGSQLDDAVGSIADTPEQLVVGKGFDATVDAALRALPEKLRAVIYAVDIEALSYAEAADVLGIPTGTVMSRLHRARTKIRDRLARADMAPRRRRRR